MPRTVLISAIIAAMLLAAHAPVFGQTTQSPNSPAAIQALKDFNAANANLAEQFNSGLERLTQTYVDEATKVRALLFERLEQARKAATAADDLDEAVLIRDTSRAIKGSPITPPIPLALNVVSSSEAGETEDTQQLESEIKRLKAALAKKDSAKKLLFAKELSSLLINTRWRSLKGDGVMGFQNGGQASGWKADPGTWTVDQDGTILIKWQSGQNWTMHVNAAFTGAVTVNDRGEGNRLKLVK